MAILKLSNPISDEQIEKRKALELKLADNRRDLEELQESLQQTTAATKKILKTLWTFDDRLSRLESYIIPIHQSTQSLTRKHNSKRD